MWRRCGGLDLAMCGICGMVSLDGGAVDERAVRAMADALVHRGPDSEGVFADGPVGLAARRGGGGGAAGGGGGGGGAGPRAPPPPPPPPADAQRGRQRRRRAERRAV